MLVEVLNVSKRLPLENIILTVAASNFVDMSRNSAEVKNRINTACLHGTTCHAPVGVCEVRLEGKCPNEIEKM